MRATGVAVVQGSEREVEVPLRISFNTNPSYLIACRDVEEAVLFDRVFSAVEAGLTLLS